MNMESQKESTVQALNKDDYIYVPSINCYLAKQKTHLGLNWYDTHKALHKENLLMPTIPQFIEFIKHLKANPNGLPDSSKQEIESILDDILTVRKPWRGEWFDADFKVDDKKLYIHYNHRTLMGQLTPQNKELLTDYLTEDKTPGIDLESWLTNANVQGLPKPGIKSGDLYYWAPIKDNNSVARFVVYSGGADLVCGRHPDVTGASLGVRASAEGASKKLGGK